MSGKEMDFINEAFADNWVVPLDFNVNGFEKDLEKFFLSYPPGLERKRIVALPQAQQPFISALWRWERVATMR